ncbi:MAG TPA: WbqC family protein [Phycisphaerae bacterium]|nr:WbqC family protein [Phycisphaerae bacterium]
MKVGIIQSNFIPWRGYFDVIDEVDVFVLHDDLQYTKNDWRNRNRIKTDRGPAWLTVPVHYANRAQLIQDTTIDYAQPWVAKHINLLRQWYRPAPHFAAYAENFFPLLQQTYGSISELNRTLLRWAMDHLGIRTPLRLSSELQVSGAKTERLIAMLTRLGATTYLSGPAAQDYLDLTLFRAHGIRLEFKTYDYAPYPQLGPDFAPAVSILDLLFNTGPDARQHLKSRTSAIVAVP